MHSYVSLKTRISTVITIVNLTGVVTEYSTIGARKAERNERPKLTRVDFFFDQGSPASRVERSVLSKILTSSPRPASWKWIIFDYLRPSCPSIPLRRFCHKIDTSFSGAFPAHLRGCKIRDHLGQSSFILCPGEALVMTWHCFAIQIRSLYSH